MSKQRWNQSEGEILLQQWKDSGMDKKSFCLNRGISYGRLLYWCKQLSTSGNKVGGTSALVRLEVITEDIPGKISISGTNGLTLQLEAGTQSISFIKALLTA